VPRSILLSHLPRLLLALVASLGFASAASALSIPLNVEFDAGTIGNFGTVTVTQNGNALDFSVSLTGSVLGANADLHEFYFNLLGSPTGVAISNTNAPNTAYVLSTNPSVAGGAGSSFEYGVGLGNGAGNPGNGVLKLATFTLSALQPLTLAMLNQTSSTSGSGVTVNVAVHVQGTSLVPGVTSETVGGIVPEPGTLVLVLSGLAGLAVAGRQRFPA
jgi:hypothetical protein